MSVWTVEIADLAGKTGAKVHVREGAKLLAYAEVLQLWSANADFRLFFNGLLANMPYRAFRWETPPVTHLTVDRPFECVVLDSPSLDVAPDSYTFSAEFAGHAAPEVVAFSNLGGDAFLVAPCPGEPLSAYAHIAAFVRDAPAEQRDRLWQEVGKAVYERLGDDPVWLNTAGAGVAWLHVRLDSRPKYYHYAPYRQSPDIQRTASED